MTAGMVGADSEELRRLAARCAQAAGQIDTLARTLRQRLYSAGWDGHDAQTFRRDWEGRHSPVLTSVASGLRAAGQTLLAEAQQQTDASSARAGAGIPFWAAALATASGRGVARALPASTAAALVQFLVKISDPGTRLAISAVWERTLGIERSVGGSGSYGFLPYDYRASASAEARVYGDASAELSSDGLTAQAGIGAGLAATLAARGRLGNDHVNVRGGAHVSAEASAKATGSAELGPRGGTVLGGVSAGARLEAGVDGNVKVSGVDVGARGEVYAGVDVHAEVEASFTVDKIKAEIDVGAAFGFGGGVSVDVEVSPLEIARDVNREAEKAWKGLLR